MRPGPEIDVCRTSHRRLLAALAPLTDSDFRSPSLLPRYSRGHVVTHLANKTRSHVWLFGGPAAGEIRQLHPAGYDPDLAADTGAGRSAAELRSDLEQSFGLLEAAWDALDDVRWDHQGIMTAGPRTMAEIISHHLRNVEVHQSIWTSAIGPPTGHRPSSKANSPSDSARSRTELTTPTCLPGSSAERAHPNS